MERAGIEPATSGLQSYPNTGRPRGARPRRVLDRGRCSAGCPHLLPDQTRTFSPFFSRTSLFQAHLDSSYEPYLAQLCARVSRLRAPGLVAMQEAVGSSPTIRFL